MLNSQERDFLKFNALIAIKFATKGIVAGLYSAHQILGEEVIDSVCKDAIKNEPEMSKTLYTYLGALAKTVLDKDVIRHGCEVAIKENLFKFKLEILIELLSALNNNSLNEKIEADDIRYILDEPDMQITNIQANEYKEDVNEPSVKTESEEKLFNDIKSSFNTKDGKVDLSNVINSISKRKKREGKSNDMSNA